VVLQVPSAVHALDVEVEANVLINPVHAEAKDIAKGHPRREEARLLVRSAALLSPRDQPFERRRGSPPYSGVSLPAFA